jgi:hypothetical protein
MWLVEKQWDLKSTNQLKAVLKQRSQIAWLQTVSVPYYNRLIENIIVLKQPC